MLPMTELMQLQQTLYSGNQLVQGCKKPLTRTLLTQVGSFSGKCLLSEVASLRARKYLTLCQAAYLDKHFLEAQQAEASKQTLLS